MPLDTSRAPCTTDPAKALSEPLTINSIELAVALCHLGVNSVPRWRLLQ
jgi:hypothetical protein